MHCPGGHHKMYSNNILNSQESTTILNASTKKKKAGKLLNAPGSVNHRQTLWLYQNSSVWLDARDALNWN